MPKIFMSQRNGGFNRAETHHHSVARLQNNTLISQQPYGFVFVDFFNANNFKSVGEVASGFHHLFKFPRISRADHRKSVGGDYRNHDIRRAKIVIARCFRKIMDIRDI